MNLNTLTDSLRRDWAFLDLFDVDASKVCKRSEVFQRNFVESNSPLPVYVKVYTYRKHPFHRFLRRGRSRSETRNLLFFKSIGISVPKVIGWGQRHTWWGKLAEEFIITESIIGAEPLDVFLKAACPDRSQPLYAARRDAIIDQISQWTREIHAHHFFHNDLYLRNILARIQNDQVALFWIDCPIGGFRHLHSGRHSRLRLKDCATLDKLARHLCTQEERKRFVAGYLGRDKNDPKVLAFCKAVTVYRRGRFDSRHASKPLKENPQREIHVEN